MSNGAGTSATARGPSLATLAALAALLAACGERGQESLRGAPPERRDALLAEAIQDVGYVCDRILDVTMAGGDAWRVLCEDMLVYVATLDSSDTLHVEPIPYGDPGPVLPESRDPDAGPDTVRPEP